MACERPRRRRLVFPVNSGIENLEGPVDDEDGDDRDGASEAGPEVEITPLEVARPRSQVMRSALARRGGFVNIVFPASEFDEEHSQIFGGTAQECHEGGH